MSRIFLCHSDCDGGGSFIAIEYLKIPYDTMMICNYGDFNLESNKKKLFQYDEILVSDFSLPTNLVLELLEANKKVTILDHHDYENNEENKGLDDINHENYIIVHDQTRSGTKITFDYFKGNSRHKKIVTDFINLVDTYDLWKLDSPFREESENLNRLFYGSLDWNNDNKYESFTKEILFRFKTFNEWEWTESDIEKINRAKKIEQDELKKAKMFAKQYIDEKGFPYLITIAPKKISFVASELLKEFPDVSYVAIINTYKDSWEKISLRSKEDFDVTQIGNGHKQAGGMETTREDAMKLFKGTEVFKHKA